MWIVFEGGEGSGKSVQIKLLEKYLKDLGYPVTCTRDPGGTKVGDEIRKLVLNTRFQEPIHPITELLLFFASRAQLLHQIIIPALFAGNIVLSDRSYGSSKAYQGGPGGIKQQTINSLVNLIFGKTLPDLIILLDVSPNVGLSRRMSGKGIKNNRFERKALKYHEKVRDTYLRIAKNRGQKKPIWVIIDGSKSIEYVFSEVIKAVNASLGIS